MDTVPSEFNRSAASRPILDAKWDGRSTFSIEEARKILGLPRSAAYAAAKSGQLPANRITGRSPTFSAIAFRASERRSCGLSRSRPRSMPGRGRPRFRFKSITLTSEPHRTASMLVPRSDVRRARRPGIPGPQA
jgi:hypothetical protein